MTDPTTSPPGAAEKSPSTAGDVIGGLITLAIVGGVLFVIFIFVANWIRDGWSGFSECKAQTREMLLDPSSAKFGPHSKATATDDDRVVRFQYSVSATNGYGGRIERQFFCIVDDSGPSRTITVY